MTSTKITRRESATVLNSLGSGVVPRIGLRHIAVGREKEIKAFLQDMKTIEDGGGAFRLVCGEYGSGKSFLLQLIRNYAMEQNFVVIDADLTPERRLTGTQNQGLATYRELMQKISIKTRPDGGALEAILQKWISTIKSMVARDNHLMPDNPDLVNLVSEKIGETLHELTEMTYGFSFSDVVDSYWRGMKTENSELKQAALRWLRGEFYTKTDAKQSLPVDSIISDNNWYEFLKLFAVFLSRTGYKGLIVFLDEGINLYKIANRHARENNYEKLLSVFNDTMQGNAHYLGFYMSGTPTFIYDEKRGLFSYEALRSRLMDHRFNTTEYIDYSGPVIKLNKLSNEEIFLLLERLCEVHGVNYDYQCSLGKEELQEFLNSSLKRIGANKLLTPREITRDFLGLLNTLQQYPETDFKTLMLQLSDKKFETETNPEQDNDLLKSNEDEMDKFFASIDI